VEKAVKVLEREEQNVIVKSFVTTSVSHPYTPFLQIDRLSGWVLMVEGITKPAIRRLARRGGVKRISGLIYEEVFSFEEDADVDSWCSQGVP
jgi:hypothetical protein